MLILAQRKRQNCGDVLRDVGSAVMIRRTYNEFVSGFLFLRLERPAAAGAGTLRRREYSVLPDVLRPWQFRTETCYVPDGSGQGSEFFLCFLWCQFQTGSGNTRRVQFQTGSGHTRLGLPIWD